MSISGVTKIAMMALGVTAGGMALAHSAKADQILAFGQTSSSNTITGTQTGSSTTITGTNVSVTVTQIAAGGSTPLPAYFDLDLTSVGAATKTHGEIVQDYSGSFSITSGTGGSGTNYLSGTLTDVAFGSGSAFTISASTPPTGAITFTSSVIPASDLGDPMGVGFSLTNVTPGLHITQHTIGSFTASISGNFSATPVAVPEPASLALLGVGLFGLGMVRRQKSKG